MPLFKRLCVPEELLVELIEHARSCLPNECCGLLAGRVEENRASATMRFAIGNDAASPREYLTNPRDMFAAFRGMREYGLELLGIYHSHPTSAPEPSQRDLEENTYGDSVVHLIVSLAGSQPEVRGWWLTLTGARAAELE